MIYLDRDFLVKNNACEKGIERFERFRKEVVKKAKVPLTKKRVIQFLEFYGWPSTEVSWLESILPINGKYFEIKCKCKLCRKNKREIIIYTFPQ